MKTLVVLLAAALAITVVSGCDSTLDCMNLCPNGYHEHCNMATKQCYCPPHSCMKDSDCPVQAGSGCPSTATCVRGSCKCNRSNKT